MSFEWKVFLKIQWKVFLTGYLLLKTIFILHIRALLSEKFLRLLNYVQKQQMGQTICKLVSGEKRFLFLFDNLVSSLSIKSTCKFSVRWHLQKNSRDRNNILYFTFPVTKNTEMSKGMVIYSIWNTFEKDINKFKGALW